MGNFKKGVEKLEKKGYSKDYAGSVMYLAGKAKYGKAGMTAKSVAGRKRAGNTKKH